LIESDYFVLQSFLVDWLRLDIGICNWWTDVRLDALNEGE